MDNTLETFKLGGKVCIITGGAGFLGRKHAEAILDADGIPILLDIDAVRIQGVVDELNKIYQKEITGFEVDITDRNAMVKVKEKVLAKYKRIDILINNAANNPKVEGLNMAQWSRFENFSEEIWDQDFKVGVTGAFLCAQVFGDCMARQKRGVILNISSDLGIIAPDQRIYRKENLSEDEQMVKPVTYSVTKHALIGLTKYLATYWASHGVRVNAICPGGVYHNNDESFLQKLTNLIPLGRMAHPDEYKAAIIFLVSDASSYMTGSTIIIDGGRTCW